MALSGKSLAGPGYIILNILRVMNIVGLLTVIASSILMIVKISMSSSFFFFEAACHVLVATISTIMILTELSMFNQFFARNWPLFSDDHSFVALGSVMILLGIEVLGGLNKPSASPEKLGLGFWRAVIGSGIIVIVLGAFNIVVSYVFRSQSLYITARHVRADGAITLNTPHAPPSAFPTSSSSLKSPYSSDYPTGSSNSPLKPLKIKTSFHSRDSLYDNVASPKSPRKSPLQSLASPFKRVGDAILPLFKGQPGEEEQEGAQRTVEVKTISRPIGVNPQFAHLVNPQKAKVRDEEAGMVVRDL